MAGLVGRRVVSMFAVLIGVSIVTFSIFFLLPGGDPASRIAGRIANPTTVDQVRQQFDLDAPLPTQYLGMMKQAIGGDLISYEDRTNVLDEIVAGLPATVSLAVGAAAIWILFGAALGILAAATEYRWPDRVITLISLLFVSIPVIWIAVLAQYLFANSWDILPAVGYVPLTEDPVQWFLHLLLPWTMLSLLFIGIYSRVLRSTILERVNDDYIRTARAKGLSERRIMVGHVLRMAVLPIVTLFGLDFAAVIGGGAIIVEAIFDLNGVGAYAASSIETLDLPPIMGVTLYSAFFIVVCSTLVDLAQLWLDPRVRKSGG